MDYFEGMRKKHDSLTDDYLSDVLQEGAARAREIASAKMEQVKKAVGLL